MAKKSKMSCPNCGATHLTRAGFQFSGGKKIVKYQCQDCGRITQWPLFDGKPRIVLFNTMRPVTRKQLERGK